MKIMNKLHVKSLLRFRMVSKSWKFTIDSNIFVREYASRQCAMCCFILKYDMGNERVMCSVDGQMSFSWLNTNFPQTYLTPISTSEGVWCFSFGRHVGAILWNPSIRKFSGIEVPYIANRFQINKIVWGFGVRPDTLDQIVEYFYAFYGDVPWHVLLYTLNSDTWRVLGNARLPRIGIRIKRSWGVAVVGSCIFWGCSKTIYNDDGSSYNLYMLVSFDLINHRFHVLDIPTQLRNDLPVPFYISKLGNSLVISGNHIDNDENRYICAWLLEVEAAVVTSWRVLFVMPSQNIAKLIGFTMDDDPIVVVDMGHEIVHTLQVYDRPSQQFHTLGIVGNGGSFFIGPYKESLILLNV
ncbi:F-box domain containing protein [Tanacetum coccineum]